jgi:hypothetical protein
VARVDGLSIYPVKSCAGIALERVTLGRAGFEHHGVGDREWMVVDARTGIFLTQRQLPRMALIRPALDAGALALTAPGADQLIIALDGFALRAPALSVKVWNHECLAFDEGNDAAAWLTAFLGRPARLARFDPAHRRLSNREWTRKVEALNRFSDGYPILAIGQASLDELNERLAEAGRETLPMNRFRPNLVLSDLGPGDEDRIIAFTRGAVALAPVKPCPRCPIPSIDQATGVAGDDPLDILARYRDRPDLGVVFGQNTVVTAGVGATLAVGDTFEIEWNF